MYYLIYKTTNLVNGKFYIGAHETSNLEDGYLGSGKILLRATKKYGLENFHREILQVCIDREHMFKVESELVNESMIDDKNCYNIKLGGFGGWSHWNNGSEQHIEVCRKSGNKNIPRLLKLSKSERMRKLRSDRNAKENLNNSYALGYKHTDETKHKISQKQLNTRWVCNETEVKKISGDLYEDYVARGYQRGKRFKKKTSTFGTAWINKNNTNKLIKLKEVELYLTDGWERGRINCFKKI